MKVSCIKYADLTDGMDTKMLSHCPCFHAVAPIAEVIEEEGLQVVSVLAVAMEVVACSRLMPLTRLFRWYQ